MIAQSVQTLYSGRREAELTEAESLALRWKLLEIGDLKTCRRGEHFISGRNAMPKVIAGVTYYQCRACHNIQQKRWRRKAKAA